MGFLEVLYGIVSALIGGEFLALTLAMYLGLTEKRLFDNDNFFIENVQPWYVFLFGGYAILMALTWLWVILGKFLWYFLYLVPYS